MSIQEEGKQESLSVLLLKVRSDNPELLRQVQEDESKLASMRADIVETSRRNFVLERDLSELDMQIEQLVRGRLSADEVDKHVKRLEKKKEGKASAQQQDFESKRGLYGQLFHYLQAKPKYFSLLSRLVSSKDAKSFVKTVVFDMFGDQYNNREERLLLSVFQMSLVTELELSTQGAVMRANTPLTQMLAAYARRGAGVSVLKDVLKDPINQLVKDKEVNLEISPLRIYLQHIAAEETRTGQCDLPKNVDDATAGQNPFVIAEQKKRLANLMRWSGVFLDRILEEVEMLPLGVRWVCKQMKMLYLKRFPDSTKYQVGSLIGGYIYLRFFNPIVVAPYMINICEAPGKVGKRNLIMVAKVLQTLSNGQYFGKKEQFMTPCNAFIEERRDDLIAYFDRVTVVEDFDDTKEMDSYLALTKQASKITITLNQVLMIHALLLKHKDKVCSEGGPVARILGQLGDTPPEQVTRDENITVKLSLVKRDQRVSVIGKGLHADPRSRPLYQRTKAVVADVLTYLPTEVSDEGMDLRTFLLQQKEREVELGAEVITKISLALTLTNKIHLLGCLPNCKVLQNTVDFIFQDLCKTSTGQITRAEKSQKKLLIVHKASTAIEKHNEYLLSRLNLYKQYLLNVRMQAQMKESKTKQKKNKKNKKAKEKDLPYDGKKVRKSHKELIEMNIIVRLTEDIPNKITKCLHYTFERKSIDVFTIDVRIKKLLSLRIYAQPVELKLSNLLRMQQHDQYEYSIDTVVLNVNTLIHLVKSEFH